MTPDTLIRGWALALRDLAELDDDAVSASITFTSGAVMTYAKGRGCKLVVPAGQVLTIPEEALDDVGLVPA